MIADDQFVIVLPPETFRAFDFVLDNLKSLWSEEQVVKLVTFKNKHCLYKHNETELEFICCILNIVSDTTPYHAIFIGDHLSIISDATPIFIVAT